MLTVTKTAIEKLEEVRENHNFQPDETFRIRQSQSKPNALIFTTDTEKEGDQVVKSKHDTKILLVDPVLSSNLEGMVLDYGEKSEVEGFTIYHQKT